MLHTAVQAAQEASEHAETLPPLAFGLIAFGALVALLAVTYAFRSVGTRH